MTESEYQEYCTLIEKKHMGVSYDTVRYAELRAIVSKDIAVEMTAAKQLLKDMNDDLCKI